MSLTDKLARSTVESSKFQQQWQTHLNMFGSLLEPMFRDDCTAKVKLVDALNHLSQQKLGPAFKIINKLMLSCKTNEDKMGILFFAGLSCEYAMDREGAMECYRQCLRYQPSFYLPYLRQAKLCFISKDLDSAEENFHLAAACMDKEGPIPNGDQILASILVNDSRILIAMHRYQEAIAAADRAASLPGQDPSMIHTTKAMAYAGMDDAQSCRQELDWLRKNTPQSAVSLEPVIQGILDGLDTQYRVTGISAEAIESFWVWMAENGASLSTQAPALIADKIRTIFPALTFTPDLTVEGNKITLKDGYNATLMEGYRKLIEAIPQNLKETLKFIQTR